MSIIVANNTFDHWFFGESLKLESVWDYTVNMKFNVFYSTFTNVFLFMSHFYVFNVFLYFNLNVFYIYVTKYIVILLVLPRFCLQCFAVYFVLIAVYRPRSVFKFTNFVLFLHYRII